MTTPPTDELREQWVDPPDLHANRERMRVLWERLEQLVAARVALEKTP